MVQDVRIVVFFVVAVVSWLAFYTLIGGTWPRPLAFGSATWAMRWRSALAALAAILLAGLAISITPGPR